MLARVEVRVIDEIAERNKQFMAFFADGNSRGVSQLYTEDGQVLPPNSEILEGPEAIAQMWQGAIDAGVASLRLEISEVHGSEDAVYELSHYQMLSADAQVIDHGKYIIIWKKIGDTWFIHRDIWNSSAPVA
jgi:ketosteroid isomerase-like protein